MQDHVHPHDYIDIYCERIEPGLWAEPLNAVTNAAFIIAGVFAFLLAKREGAMDWRSLTLVTLIFAMGIGSALFHTFATLWAMASDVIPILLFQIGFIIFYSHKIMGCNRWKILGLLVIFVALMQGAMQLPREWLNGSLEYFPALILLSGFALYHVKNAAREPYALMIAAGTFCVSLTFRSIDYALCELIPFGTHFLWHCLNAVVLYLCTRSYIFKRE